MSRGVGHELPTIWAAIGSMACSPANMISATVGQVNQQVASARDVSGFAPTYFPGTTSPAE
jgi:hypothetical protein